MPDNAGISLWHRAGNRKLGRDCPTLHTGRKSNQERGQDETASPLCAHTHSRYGFFPLFSSYSSRALLQPCDACACACFRLCLAHGIRLTFPRLQIWPFVRLLCMQLFVLSFLARPLGYRMDRARVSPVQCSFCRDYLVTELSRQCIALDRPHARTQILRSHAHAHLVMSCTTAPRNS